MNRTTRIPKTRPLTLIALAMTMVMGLVVSLINPGKAIAAACQAPPVDYGTVTTTVNVPTAATFRIWTRISVPDVTNNTYLLQIDSDRCYAVGGGTIAANTWTWVAYQNGAATSYIDAALTQGNHTLKLLGNKPGVKIDRLVFLSDLTCVPAGSGDNCNIPNDTVPPVAHITAPTANASVSGTANVAATATDAVGVTKVEFYVNGILNNTDTTSPYSYSLNTTTIPNGTQLLSVRAYDAAGNIGTDSIQVAVQNGDTQAPTVPTNVQAVANAYNKVTVTWTASTDNTLVKGYRVFRDGVPITDVTTGVTYVDTAVVGNTTYNYKVAAYDAAGNTSAQSTAASVRTPVIPDTQAPTQPTSLNATAISTNQINLAWTASTDNVGVVSYDVYRSTGTAAAAKIGTSTTIDFADTNLTRTTTYRYYVVAKDAVGNSSLPSATRDGTTLTTPPSPIPNAPPATNPVGILGYIRRTDNGAVLPQARLTFYDGTHHYTFQVNSAGAFSIRWLQPGRYSLTGSADGFYSKTVSVNAQAAITLQNINLDAR